MNSYSIPQDGVFNGLWMDHSDGKLIVTLPVRYAGYLIAATAFFVGIVGARMWSLWAFFIHWFLARKEQSDGLGLHHRISVCNAGSEANTIWQLYQMWSAWKKSTPKPKHIGRRTMVLALVPLINVLAFAVAGIFSSKVAGKNNESNNVKLAPKICGTLAPNLGLNITEDRQQQRFLIQMALNNTQAARQYAHTCYPSGSNLGQCSMFPTRYIPYSADTVDCPFGHTPAGNDICQPNAGKALQLATPSLNTNKIFGINVKVENQIEVRKSLTCAPIQITEYVRTDNPGLDNATTYLELGPVPGGSTYTLSYKPRSKNDSVGYQLFSLTSADGGVWSPTDALKVSHGDVSVTVLAGNSVKYLEPVKDPWFSANIYDNDKSAYLSDNDLSVIACIDQYQICNPSSSGDSKCTILGSYADMYKAFVAIGLNKYQIVLAARMLNVFGMAAIWQSIDFEGAGAILASRNVISLVSSGLPDNQWELEVRDWFETSLAITQAAVVQYVNNLDQDTLGDYAKIALPSAQLTGVVENYMCDAQRVRNTGGYISFSFAWLIFIYVVGAVLVALSFVLQLQWVTKRISPRRHVVRTADLLVQIERKYLESMEYGEDEKWTRQMEDVPIIRGDKIYLLPKLQESAMDGARDFLPTRPKDWEMGQLANSSDYDGVRATAVGKERQAEEKRDWLPSVAVSEHLEATSLIDEAIENHRRHSGRPESSQSSISALTNP